VTALRRLLGILLAVAATAAGVALSQVEMAVAPAQEALVRLSWRATARRVERCRVPTEEELAAVPLHMRRAEICEGGLAPFRLRVVIDGETRIDREVRPAGAREDRPTYVLELLPIPPGTHQLEVRFSVVGESDEPALELATAIRPDPRDVILVTRDTQGALVARHD
jgi:hypothetical protein